MFVRNVSLNLKPNTLTEFVKTMESEIVPLLRKQKGFQDAITLAVPGGREVVAISFWEQKENAQAYNSTGYAEVLKILKDFWMALLTLGPLMLSVRQSRRPRHLFPLSWAERKLWQPEAGHLSERPVGKAQELGNKSKKGRFANQIASFSHL